MQLQIFNLTGARLYDSQPVRGTTLLWKPINSESQSLAQGVYLYLITVKGAEGRTVRSALRKLVIK